MKSRGFKKAKDRYVIRKINGELLCASFDDSDFVDCEDVPILFKKMSDALHQALPREKVISWHELSSEERPKLFVLFKPNSYFVNFIMPLNN